MGKTAACTRRQFDLSTVSCSSRFASTVLRPARNSAKKQQGCQFPGSLAVFALTKSDYIFIVIWKIQDDIGSKPDGE